MSDQYLCEICKQPGAKFREYRKVTGLLIISLFKFTKPRALCDNHKFSGGVKTNLWNLFLGWWGIHAFFWNIFALITNALGGRDATKEVENAYITYLNESADALARQAAMKL